MKVVTASDAPEGQSYVTFSNTEPGRGCRALQGFAIDGRKVRELKVSCMVRCKNVAPGPMRDQTAQLAVIFMDENRAPVGSFSVGGREHGFWQGSFEWQKATDTFRVPGRAREAIVTIGLLGGTGEVSYDDVQVAAVK